jgi:hypothetical protein
MGRTAPLVICPRLQQAQGAVYSLTHFGSIGIFLAIVGPPADRAYLQSLRKRKRPESAARAPKRHSHTWIDGFSDAAMTVT